LQKIISGSFENKLQMLENEQVMTKLLKAQNLSYILDVEEKSYQIQSAEIAKSKIPVREPTTRGGVYFTDVEAYKIKAQTSDVSIKDEIPKLMLGPNTDFKPILLRTSLMIENKEHLVTLTTHLTNAVSSKGLIELNLIVDKVDLK
jgi:hypothetical protein